MLANAASAAPRQAAATATETRCENRTVSAASALVMLITTKARSPSGKAWQLSCWQFIDCRGGEQAERATVETSPRYCLNLGGHRFAALTVSFG